MYRINRSILAANVRVITEEGEQLGVMPLDKAIERAEMAGLDLIEVSPNAEPPVCKIQDYGKLKYQTQKKAAETRKKQHVVTVKEISIRPGTEEHDYQIKMKKARQFIEKGDKVKINLRFRGREITHKDLGTQMLDRIEADFKEIAKVDQRPKMEGRQMIMVMSPLATKG